MLNYELLIDDDFSREVIENRWKINDTKTNFLLVDILENYGVDFIWQDEILIPTNITFIGKGGFSSVYEINGNNDIVIKITNEITEIKFTKQLIEIQKNDNEYSKYIVKCQLLIPSNILSKNETEDYHEKENSFIILEKLNKLNEDELNHIRELNDYFKDNFNEDIWDYVYEEFDELLFQQRFEDYLYSTYEYDSNEFIFLNEFFIFFNNVIKLMNKYNWGDFHIHNIMKDNHNNLKVIDLQTETI